jgi:hypothetical protein
LVFVGTRVGVRVFVGAVVQVGQRVIGVFVAVGLVVNVGVCVTVTETVAVVVMVAVSVLVEFESDAMSGVEVSSGWTSLSWGSIATSTWGAIASGVVR